MSKLENRILDFIKKYFVVIVAVAVTVLAVLVRLYGYYFISVDMRDYLIKWFWNIVATGRIKSLKHNIGNYNLLYLTILSLLSYIKAEPVFIIKTLSVVFDFLLAVAAAMLVYDHSKGDRFRKSVLCYSIVLMLPAVCINSSVWGQCDSMYTAFLVLCLVFFGREKYRWGFVMFALALSLKLQAVFLLPFLLFFYFKSRRFSILNFLLIPGVMLLTGVPAAIMGRPILDVFRIYFQQTSDFQYPTMLYPNVYSWLDHDYLNFAFAEFITPIAVFIALFALAAGFFCCERKLHSNTSFKNYLVFAAWACYTCVMFLPRMHERYGFAAEILLVVLALLDRKYILYAVVSSIVALISYMPFLFGLFTDQTVLSFVNVGLYLLFTFGALHQNFALKKSLPKNEA